jgi:hypothetical protein
MSYGREPHYIYSCSCSGSDGHPVEPHVAFSSGAVVVRWSELTQFLRRLMIRNELAQVINGTHEHFDGRALVEELRKTEPRADGWGWQFTGGGSR